MIDFIIALSIFDVLIYIRWYKVLPTITDLQSAYQNHTRLPNTVRIICGSFIGPPANVKASLSTLVLVMQFSMDRLSFWRIWS